MDSNARHFFIEAVDIEANVDADSTSDFVTIEFAGKVTPTVKKRLTAAFMTGEFEIKEKKIA